MIGWATIGLSCFLIQRHLPRFVRPSWVTWPVSARNLPNATPRFSACRSTAAKTIATGYPVVGDSDLKVAKLYNMLPAEETGSAEQRTAADNATVRAVYIVGPDKKIRAMLLYPMSSGRNFEEVLRLLDSVQLTESKGVATPVNWQSGDDVIIPPSVSDKEAKARFPQGFTTLRPYLRTVKID